jgi:hypothetical protein
MDDGIANGTYEPRPASRSPLSLFTAPRVDYSLHRLRHYTRHGALSTSRTSCCSRTTSSTSTSSSSSGTR